MAKEDKTWWGKQWFHALKESGHLSRLTRGKTYANKGAVKSFSMEGSTIEAQVKGSQRSPYRVEICVPTWPEQQKQQLLKNVMEDPMLVAHLLAGELDTKMLEHTNALALPLLPAFSNDLNMSCSCPDYAVPCKHIAASTYIFLEHLAEDPFILFTLRGLNLRQEVSQQHPEKKPDFRANAPDIEAVLDRIKHTCHGMTEHQESEQALDYSMIPNLVESLATVLDRSPAFNTKEAFRTLFLEQLVTLGSHAEHLLLMDKTTSAFLTHELKPVFVMDVKGDLKPLAKKNKINFETLTEYLLTINPSDFSYLSSEVKTLYEVLQLALQLLKKGACIPLLYARSAHLGEPDSKKKNHEFGMIWLPVMSDEVIQQLLQRVSLNSTEVLHHKTRPLGMLEQTVILCAAFIKTIMSSCPRTEPIMEPVLALFFEKQTISWSPMEVGVMTQRVNQWLAVLNLGHYDYTHILCISDQNPTHPKETKDGFFYLSFAIKPPSLSKPIPLHELMEDAHWEKERYHILKNILLIAPFLFPLKSYVENNAKKAIALSTQEMPVILFKLLPMIRLLGINTLIPKGLDKILRPEISMHLKVKNPKEPLVHKSFLALGDLLTFDWRIAVGNHVLEQKEFEALISQSRRLVQFKGEYLYLDPELLDKIRHQLTQTAVLDRHELMRIALTEQYEEAPVSVSSQLKEQLEHFKQLPEVLLPKKLNATLRPYQKRGFDWIYRNSTMGLGSIVADDMGLGKTLQVIASIVKMNEEGMLKQSKVLIVVPTSLLTNWEKELTRFAPNLSYAVYHGAGRSLPKKRTDIVLTSYGTLRSDTEKLTALTWRLMVIDEAQHIKNPDTAQTQAVKNILAESYVAMSGTPVENRLSEYWSIMDFVNPGYLGSLSAFNKRYAKPIQIEGNQNRLNEFKRLVEPFLLRRLKSDKRIIEDLPEKLEQNEYCQLTLKQIVLYESVVQESLSVIEGESNAFKRDGLVLQMIMALKQICNHPAQYDRSLAANPTDSGKSIRLLELVQAIYEAEEKVLIFTQFKETGLLIQQWLNETIRYQPQFLHGGVPRSKRDKMVDDFQHNDEERMLILSLKAGGTGLNLTAANHVIHYDLWWNPAVEAQATDRAYRIGQKKNVQVHRLITEKSFEEKIDAMIQAKKALVDMTVSAGESWIGQLDNQALRNLFER